ncbi:MAG: bifunctional 2-C-methyl-D-erythritol 4-phosphate cytidylyltransferase/2-C-methyl-D-erythritol 2,4-cyclodiphosphate synthase [Pseudomonadota bacterium]
MTTPEHPVIALVVAAGRGRRFGGDLPKQYQTLVGRPLLAWTLEALLAHPRVTHVRAVIHPDDQDLYQQAIAGLSTPRLLDPVPGGAERQDSVRLGLESLLSLPDSDQALVLIHDGARPFPTAALLDGVIDALATQPGALPCLPVTDTVKRARDGVVLGTLPRDELYRAQTPQGFRLGAILEAHRHFAGQAMTDDSALAEAAGLAVALVPGDAGNIKVTTAEDLDTATQRLQQAKPQATAKAELFETRIGSGYDVHRLEPGDGLWLCGLFIPHNETLAGHSDADVAIHALVDALLGAMAEGDIGQHFPPSDPQWRGAASHLFLRHACGLLETRGGRIINLDLTLVCERPKIGPHRPALRASLAQIAGVPESRVSVKATTSEKLGFTGRGEGMAALASVSIQLPASA